MVHCHCRGHVAHLCRHRARHCRQGDHHRGDRQGRRDRRDAGHHRGDRQGRWGGHQGQRDAGHHRGLQRDDRQGQRAVDAPRHRH
jgi:hypothetical protein